MVNSMPCVAMRSVQSHGQLHKPLDVFIVEWNCSPQLLRRRFAGHRLAELAVQYYGLGTQRAP